MGKFLIFIFISGCQSFIELNTYPPGANVFDAKGQPLGVTPLRLTGLAKDRAGGSWLTVNHPGFEPLFLWVPGTSEQKTMTVNLKNLKTEHHTNPELLEKTVHAMLEYQTRALTGLVTQEDLAPIQSWIEEHPHWGAPKILKALVLLRLNDPSAAAVLLEKALEESSWDAHILGLLQEVKAQLKTENRNDSSL